MQLTSILIIISVYLIFISSEVIILRGGNSHERLVYNLRYALVLWRA